MTGVFYLFGLIFILCFSGKIISSDIRYVYAPFTRQLNSEKYLSTTGTITQSKIYSQTNSTGVINCRINVAYKYQVGGQQQEAHRFRYIGDSLFTEDISVTACRMGSHVMVFYNPQDPTDALLSPGITGEDLAPFFKSLSFLYIMLIIGGLCFFRLLRAVFRPLAGGVKIICEAQLVRVQLPWFSPTTVAIMSGIFGLICLSLLPSQWHKSLAIAVMELLSNLGVVIIAYLWLRYKIRSGNYNLDISNDAGTITLPKKYGCKNRLTLKISEISTVTVDTEVWRGNNSINMRNYVPSLHLRHKDSETIPLIKWQEKGRAEDFAVWLRKELGLQA
jgi:hypothetical protein